MSGGACSHHCWVCISLAPAPSRTTTLSVYCDEACKAVLLTPGFLLQQLQQQQQAVTPRGGLFRVGSWAAAPGAGPSASGSLGTTSNRYSSINRLVQRNGLVFKLPQRASAGAGQPPPPH